MFAILGGVASAYNTIVGSNQNPVVDVDKNVCQERWGTDEATTAVTDLVIYPCRGVQGIHLEEAKIFGHGFEYDREWSLIRRDITPEENKIPGKRWVSINANQDIPQIK